jgi:hypothetical protein
LANPPEDTPQRISINFNDPRVITRLATPADERRGRAMAAAKKNPQQLKNAPPQTLWETIKDAFDFGSSEEGDSFPSQVGRAVGYPAYDAIQRESLRRDGMSPTQAAAEVAVNRKKRVQQVREAQQYHAEQVADDDSRQAPDAVHALAHWAAKTAGAIGADANPLYATPIGGESALARIGLMGGQTGLTDAAGQGADLSTGVRDEFDPTQVAEAAIAGAALQGAGEGVAKGVSSAVSKVKGGRLIRAGAAHPDYDLLNNIIVGDLEGGGTIAHPRVSPKGARGPQQVMPDTARDPGFGIRKSNGSAVDDVRVGKQYTAAMLGKYGEPDLALAAYNWGPGNLDKALDKYGQKWFEHAPRETQEYVVKGMGKYIERKGSGSTGGPVRPMAPEDMANAMNDTGMKNAITGQDNIPDEGIFPTDENGMAYDPSFDEDFASGKVDDMGNPSESDTSNVVDLGHVRENLDRQKTRNLLDDKIESAMHHEDAVLHDESPMTLEEARGNRETAEKMHEMLPNDHPYKDKTASLVDIWRNVEHTIHERHTDNAKPLREHLSDYIKKNLEDLDNSPDHKALRDIDSQWGDAMAKLKSGEISFDEYDAAIKPLQAAHAAILKRMDTAHEEHVRKRDTENQSHDASTPTKPLDNTGYEKHTPYVGEPKAPANEGRYEPRPEGKTLHEYTDSEWKRLSPEDKKALIDEDNDRIFYGPANRDRNPPASSSSLGQRQKGPNYKGPEKPKGPEDHERPELRTEKKKVIDKLGDLIDQSTPIRREAEAQMSFERKQRLAAAYAAKKGTPGREGTRKALAALKGEMSRPKIKPIADQFSQSEIDALHDGIWNSPALEGYEPVRAARALDLLLHAGEVPTPSDVALLARVMPQKASVWKRLLENEEGSVPDGAIKSAIVDTLGITRTLKASFDVSAPGRQGIFLIGTKHWWADQKGMFKSFVSEKEFHELSEEIRNRPTFDLMNKAGLEITKPAEKASIMDREEAFVSKFAEKIPGVRQSERAYLAFLNKLRADVFDDFVKKGEVLGIDFVQEPEYLKSAAKFINAATGRGQVKWVGRNAELLSKGLFSPKLMASRLQLMNPMFYARLHPDVRGFAIKQGLIATSAMLSVMGLAAAAGASVEKDPRSSDFGKIVIGNTRFDVTGGFQPYVRFFAQMIMGQQKSLKGVVRNIGPTLPLLRQAFPGQKQGAYKPTTRLDLLYRFMENKESPNFGEVTRLLRGTDPVGNKLTVGSELENLFAPLIVSDTYHAMKDLGPLGIFTAVPNAFGIGVQTYTPKAKKAKSNDPYGFKDSSFNASDKDFK